MYTYICIYIYTQYITVDYRNLRLWSVLVCVCLRLHADVCTGSLLFLWGNSKYSETFKDPKSKVPGRARGSCSWLGVWAASFVCPTGPTPHSLFVQPCSPGHAVCSRETFSVPMPASVRWFKWQNIYVETTRSLPSETCFFFGLPWVPVEFSWHTLRMFVRDFLDGWRILSLGVPQ